ncbi:MAG: hypothetical protein AB7N76_26790 [Planctomycetota bacterium]
MGDSDQRPDVSDLKTYDVPDPELPRSGFKLGLIAAPVGLLLALGFLQAVRVNHYFAVLANPRERSHQRDQARRFASELPAEQLLERVLALDSPEVRGSFHKALAETGDAAHVEAIMAYLGGGLDRQPSYEQGREAKEVLESLQKYPAEQIGPRLVGFARSQHDARVRDAVKKELEQWPAESLLKPVLAIEDAAERGSWHWVLPASKDPDQIDAILAHCKKQQSSDRLEAEAKSLLAFGKAGTDKLKQALHEDDRRLVNLAAEALVKVNLAFVTGYCREQLDAYTKLVFEPRGLAWASTVLSEAERASSNPARLLQNKISAADMSAARAKMAEGTKLAFLTLEMLKAMQTIEGEQVDFCFLQGLSTFDQQVAQLCAETLERRLSTDQLVDGMFHFMAQKASFSRHEVDVFEGMLHKKGVVGALRVAKNLDQLLVQAKGQPEQVFFLYKKIGFKTLKELGTKACLPTLERYARDTDTYVVTQKNNMGLSTEHEVKFSDEVAAAVAAINGRGR